MSAPVLMNPIPPQIVNEHAAYGPFDLKKFIQAAEGTKTLHFAAELKGGKALPVGMICTEDGILTGIPASGTNGNYEIVVTATTEEGSLQAEIVLIIKPNLTSTEAAYLAKLKTQVWEALEQKLPIPDLTELYERAITIQDVYYLMERWGILKVWDAYNLDAPGELTLLTLEGASPHYQVYDRGSCIIACPTDLFSHERTLEDGMRTARAVAREVYKREWTVELAGFDKLTRVAWLEIQHLGDLHGKPLEVINFQPTLNDIKLYAAESMQPGKRAGG